MTLIIVSSVTGSMGATSHWRGTTHARSAREVEPKVSHLMAHLPADGSSLDRRLMAARYPPWTPLRLVCEFWRRCCATSLSSSGVSHAAGRFLRGHVMDAQPAFGGMAPSAHARPAECLRADVHMDANAAIAFSLHLTAVMPCLG